MSTCICSECRSEKSFTSAHGAVIAPHEKDAIIAGSELLAISQEKWMSIYRCHTCHTLWAEACYSSGHMDIFYLFPAPPTEDPVQWLHEQATPL